MFDHAKWVSYAATVYTWLEDNDRAEEHALETIQMHTLPDGTSNAPMRTYTTARRALTTGRPDLLD
ncbi:hypothetical protein ACQPZZ_00125 [Microbispora sp. CA-135349]|uniref:hypothetical protein n=1 Tax=Microbispora sp. CA-135349 TaxID=3239953 RepID=UPI003D92387C